MNAVENGCQIMTNKAVSSLWINGGDSGKVTLNVHNANQQTGQGGNRVQFLIYSSEPQYVNFTSVPPCGYTTAPNFNSPSCIVSGPSSQNLRTFQFDFIVSPSYGVSPSGGSFRQPASVTISLSYSIVVGISVIELLYVRADEQVGRHQANFGLRFYLGRFEMVCQSYG